MFRGFPLVVSFYEASGVVKISAVLGSLVVAGLLLGGCASNQASNGTQAYASARGPQVAPKTSARDPWTMQTPFGISTARCRASRSPTRAISRRARSSSIPQPLSLLHPRQRPGDPLQHRRRRGGLRLLRHHHVSMKREWPDWTRRPASSSASPICRRIWHGGPG